MEEGLNDLEHIFFPNEFSFLYNINCGIPIISYQKHFLPCKQIKLLCVNSLKLREAEWDISQLKSHLKISPVDFRHVAETEA